jgi:hypothetical protein
VAGVGPSTVQYRLKAARKMLRPHLSSRPGRKPSPEVADRHRAIAHAHLLGVPANLLAQIHVLALPLRL